MKKYILCVDDDKTVLESLHGQLKSELGDRYNYEAAESAEEAMEVIEDLHGDENVIVLIVSDWLMPRIRGDEFLVEVHKKYPGIVKLMLTGQADAAAIENARRNGGLHTCIDKPWKKEDLIQIIHASLA